MTGLPPIDFHDLFAFVHVARQQSFSRAAGQLRVAQSALSRRVARLEHMMAVKLVAREGRGIRLTDAGTILLERSEDLMRNLTAVFTEVRTLAREPTGHVRVAFTPTTGQILAPLLVKHCKERLPGVTLELREGFTGYIHDWLMGGQLDLALLYNPQQRSDLVITPLLREPLYLIAPTHAPDLPKIDPKSRFDIQKLCSLPLILPSRSHSIRLLIERIATERSMPLNIQHEVDGMRLTKGLVAAGLGFTVFSYAGVYEEVQAKTLRAIPLSPCITWNLSLVERKMSPPPRALIEVKSIINSQVRTLVGHKLWRGELVQKDVLTRTAERQCPELDR